MRKLCRCDNEFSGRLCHPERYIFKPIGYVCSRKASKTHLCTRSLALSNWRTPMISRQIQPLRNQNCYSAAGKRVGLCDCLINTKCFIIPLTIWENWIDIQMTGAIPCSKLSRRYNSCVQMCCDPIKVVSSEIPSHRAYGLIASKPAL